MLRREARAVLQTDLEMSLWKGCAGEGAIASLYNKWTALEGSTAEGLYGVDGTCEVCLADTLFQLLCGDVLGAFPVS